MQWKDIRSDWPAYARAIRARWPEVNFDEVAGLDGDRAAFNAYLGRVCGLTPREAEEQIDEWLQGPLPLDAVMDRQRDNRGIMESARHTPEGEDEYAEDGDFGDDRLAASPVGRTN